MKALASIVLVVGMLYFWAAVSAPQTPPMPPTNATPSKAELRGKSRETISRAENKAASNVRLQPDKTGGVKVIRGDGTTIPVIFTMPVRLENGPVAVQASYDNVEWFTLITNLDTGSNEPPILTQSYLTNCPYLFMRLINVPKK